MGASFKYLPYFAMLAEDFLEYQLNAETVGQMQSRPPRCQCVIQE